MKYHEFRPGDIVRMKAEYADGQTTFRVIRCKHIPPHLYGETDYDPEYKVQTTRESAGHSQYVEIRLSKRQQQKKSYVVNNRRYFLIRKKKQLVSGHILELIRRV